MAAVSARRVVDTCAYDEAERAEVWRAVFAPRFEVTALADDVAGRAIGYTLGPLTLSRTRHPRQSLSRTPQAARRDGAAELLFSTELSGGFESEIGGARETVGVGAVSVWDLSRPAIKHSRPGETLCAHVDRDAWERIAPAAPSLNGLTLGPLAGLARDHLLSLERTLAADPGQGSPELAQATLHILAACIRPERDRELLEPARAQVSLLIQHRAERFIRLHLADPELSPERIARAIGVSRSGLYALFEASGGVAARIRVLRLELAHALLAAGGRRIGDIAFAVGFAGPTQFSRAFRAHFGYPPGEVRRTSA